jgi:hypothetical protein
MNDEDYIKAIRLSRRRLICAAGAAAGGGVVIAAALAAPSARAQVNKVSQKQVHYRPTPSGNAQCSKCVHFLPPSHCAVVQGTISPHGWCTMYAPKL